MLYKRIKETSDHTKRRKRYNNDYKTFPLFTAMAFDQLLLKTL
jgi:hypothetical protein